MNNLDDNIIVHKTNHEMNIINTLNNSKRLDYIAKKKVLKHFKSRNLYSNGVYVLNNFFICKRLHTNMAGYLFWKNEINALKIVIVNKHFPQLISEDPNNLIIYMTYCGKSLEDGAIIPDNWRTQYSGIKQTLLKKMMNPNDILPRNICVLNGIIKLIDFGLSNVRYNEIIKSLSKLETILYQYSNN
jgi:hypothetical protein